MYKITPMIIHKVILFGVIITPVFTFGELLTLLNYNNDEIFSTPLFIKGIKDFIFLLLIFISIIFIFKRRAINKSSFILLSIILFILSISLFSLDHTIIYLAGIRWIMPFILAFFLISYVNEDLLKQISRILGFLLILTILMQFFQFLSIDPNYGEVFYRTNGFFESPTTCGFFIVISFFFNYFYGCYKLRKIVLFLTPIGLYFSFSKTGIIIYILIILVSKYYFNLFKILIYAIIFALISFFLMLVFIPDSITVSLATRINFLIDALEQASFLSSNFGISTNTFTVIQRLYNIPHPFIPSDAFLTSLLVNLGAFIFILVLGAYFFLLYYSYSIRNKSFTIFLLIYGIFGLTISITEAYPMNFLFSILLANYLSIIKFKCSKQ